MNHTAALLSLPYDCETTMALVAVILQGKGFNLKRTFDLRSACATLGDPTCPHHADQPCNCQLIVYLVYDQDYSAVALFGHGYDDKTEVRMENSTGIKPSHNLATKIRQALIVP